MSDGSTATLHRGSVAAEQRGFQRGSTVAGQHGSVASPQHFLCVWFSYIYACSHAVRDFMLCLRFVLVDICMRICPSLVHLCMLRMRMTYIVPRPRHMPACMSACSMLVMPAPPASPSDAWACVSIGMHAIRQAHPRQRQAGGRPSGHRHGLLFVMMWARPRRNRHLLRGSRRSSGATLAAGRGTSG